MSDLEATTEGPPLLDPDEVSGRTFATAFRGFDPVQVRSFLGVIADELRRLHARAEELEALVSAAPMAEAVNQGSEADEATIDEATPAADPVAAIEADASAAAASMVEEARREADALLREAKERVAVLGSAATAETSRVLEEARIEAVRIRATAADDLKGRSEDAEATAVRKIAEAEREAAAIRVKAREESDATIEAARERGREMVAEAQAARERMLADLAKRKRAAQAQLEQLRSGRDRLLDTLKVARRSIDEMTTRFDTGDGGTSTSIPPASGIPAAPVTTTPGTPSSEARGRVTQGSAGAAASDEPAVARPIRTRAVTIGEAPGASRAQIFAPQAHDVIDGPVTPQPLPADIGPSAETVVLPVSSHARPLSTSSTTDPSPAPQSQVPAVPRTEERRSSALRILRRHRPVEPAVALPPVGRDSHGEGVRIIGRQSGEPDAEQAAPPDVEVAIDAETAPDRSEPEAFAPEPSEPESEPFEFEPSEPELPPAHMSLPEPEQFDPEPEPEQEQSELARVAITGEEPSPTEPEPPGPVVLEEIRPRIEDLFARIRADREATTATARQTLGLEPDPVPSTADESVAVVEGAPPTVEVPRQRAEEAVRDGDENLLQARDSVTEPLAAQLTKRLKRALQDEQNASLDRLRTSRGPARVEQVLARPDDQATPYRHLAGPFLEQAARAGVATAPFGVIEIPVEDLASQLAVELSGALRSRLDAVLADAASDDLDLSALSERISSVYRDWKVQKVERLATHYLIAAHERGGFLARPESTPLRWIVDDDGSCPDCDDNALAGPTPRGQAFPTGQLHPPAHLGCRCLLTTTPA